MTIPLARGPARDGAETLVRRGLEWMPPALPGLAPGAVRRWQGQPTWQPPETIVLARHRASGRAHWVTSNGRRPPEDYELDYDLGLVQQHEQPGTRLLVMRDGAYDLADPAVPVPEGTRGLGHIEQSALPMMHELELRRVPETGQEVLAAGPADPLRRVTEYVRRLGFVEGFPIEPRRLVSPQRLWNFTLLARVRDADHWRHRYETVAAAGELDTRDSLALGSLWQRPGRGLIQLWRHADGRVTSDIHTPWKGRPGRAAVNASKWVAAPLGWSRPPAGWALRATASRARHLARAGEAASVEERALGYLRAEPAAGCSPLFSAVHPVLPDQYLTRSTIEAKDMGYSIEGVLGYVADVGAARTAGPREVLWGSRFGKSRRYVED